MVLCVGSEIDEFTVTEVLYNHEHLNIYEVVDTNRGKHVLKMYKVNGSVPDSQEGIVKCFRWAGCECVVQGDGDTGKKDYFKLGCGRVRPVCAGKQSGGIVRTPMPCGPETEEEDDDEEGSEDDDDEEEDDDDADDDDDNDEFVETCQNTGCCDKLRPILLHDTDTVQSNVNHVYIQSPVQKAFHASHKHWPRTPTPGIVRTDENGMTQRNIDNGRCHFQLKMISSSMLKRRGAKSMAM